MLKHNVKMSLERGTNGIFPFRTEDGSTQGQTASRHVLHPGVALNKLLNPPHINEEGALLLDSIKFLSLDWLDSSMSKDTSVPASCYLTFTGTHSRMHTHDR